MYKIIGADGKEYGPVTVEVLRQWLAEGRADARTRVLAPGVAEWRALAQVPELAELLAAAPAQAQPEAATPGPEQPRTNGLAVTGLILGIVAASGAVCFVCCYGFPFNVLGIIFSAVALSRINRDPAGQQGRGMAIAGLVLSILSIVMAVLFLLLGGMAWGPSDILRRLQTLPR